MPEVASAKEFVQALPSQENTMIGERGIRLSMGEKQRLTLARALLKDPPILVLDEATASVDVETEKYIQEALDHLIKDRTTLIIAHRLSTIRNADQIIFRGRKLMEQGNHSDWLIWEVSTPSFAYTRKILCRKTLRMHAPIRTG